MDSRYLAWTDQLRTLARRSWAVAEALYDLCLDRLRDRSVPLPTEARLEVVQRIHRVLTGTARTLEGTLPRELRAHVAPLLRIDWVDAQAIARWEEGPADVRFDLTADVIRQRSLDLSDIPRSILQVLPDLMVDGIRRGDVHLPGFEREPQSTESTVWMRWIPPSVDEIIKSRASRQRERLPAR